VSPPGRVFFFGGNGHCAARLQAARAAAAACGLTIDEAPYPGFEGRPRARDLDAFLEAIPDVHEPGALVYATGIGGLIALCLRARSRLIGCRLLLQAPVLWGLERRLMPRIMRVAMLRRLGAAVVTSPLFRGPFVRRYFQRSLSDDESAAFFDGYARCTALADLFAWMTPALLRRLECHFQANRAALDDVSVWWGERDHVVGLEELRWTEAALDVRWPLRVFPQWGHYPMIDAPEEWVAALAARGSPSPFVMQ
jgi:pimeloyl-ACP methyl ester carboxylesterase